jgi:hypothetical protein
METMMTTIQKPYDMIVDFITGEQVPNIGSEENRQKLERFLVTEKGYDKADIQVDMDIVVWFKEEPYRSTVDLIISIEDIRFMAIKCVAGAIDTWEREILAAARVFEKNYQIPFCAVCDGQNALVIDTITGKKIGNNPDTILSKSEAVNALKNISLQPLPENRFTKEQMIFRSYDLENVNVKRNIQNNE